MKSYSPVDNVSISLPLILSAIGDMEVLCADASVDNITGYGAEIPKYSCHCWVKW